MHMGRSPKTDCKVKIYSNFNLIYLRLTTYLRTMKHVFYHLTKNFTQ